MRAISVFMLALVCVVVAPAQELSGHGEFMNKFAAAVKADDFNAQSKLLDDNKKHILNGFMNWENAWCRFSQGEDGNSKESAAWIMQVLEALASINTIKGERDKFLVQRIPWLQGLTNEQKRAKLKMRTLLDSSFNDWNKVMKTPVLAEAQKLASVYGESVGYASDGDDQYWAANNCNLAAKVLEKVKDWYGTAYWYKKGAAFGETGHARAKVEGLRLDYWGAEAAKQGKLRFEFIDVTVATEESKKKYETAIAKATADAVKGGGKPGEPAAGGGVVAPKNDEASKKAIAAMPPAPNKHPDGADLGWAEVSGLKVSKLKKWPTIHTSYFRANAHWTFWDFIQVQREQAMPVRILPLSDTVLENRKGKLMLHPGGKGKGKEERLKLGPKAKLREFKKVSYDDGSSGKLWHEMMVRPNRYQQNGFTMGGSSDLITVLYRGGTMVAGKLRGVKFELHDANGNGKFNDWGADYLIFGKGKKAQCRALSKYIELDGLMYEFGLDANGKTVRTKPYTGPIAPLKFEYKSGIKPSAMLARGNLVEDQNYFHDLLQCREKPQWVVPGDRIFWEGYIAMGKGDKRQTIWIQRGRARPFTVTAGMLNIWKMGGAGDGGFVFDAKATVEKGSGGKSQIVLLGSDVKIYGSFGELYASITTGHVTPQVQVSVGKASTKAVIKKKMRAPERTDVTKNSNNMFCPKTLELKKEFSGSDYRFKLSADYKPLGRIQSDWITGN